MKLERENKQICFTAHFTGTHQTRFWIEEIELKWGYTKFCQAKL